MKYAKFSHQNISYKISEHSTAFSPHQNPFIMLLISDKFEKTGNCILITDSEIASAIFKHSNNIYLFDSHQFYSILQLETEPVTLGNIPFSQDDF